MPKITIQISDETFKQYKERVEAADYTAFSMLAYHARMAILREIRSEVSCNTKVVTVLPEQDKFDS